MATPTIVLVHGARADASSWNAVASELQSQGHTVLGPPNLLRGPVTDAAYISSFLAQRTTGPVVLVGHSYGGGPARQLRQHDHHRHDPTSPAAQPAKLP
ncbi:hypothetical protein GCM10010172_62300 [Paractinoplanes ferrugineus]|uniref:AB hydrolase-1 domain-containing protein n=1 Tax=Paractinoplanes ferrugineus TaxID=113564 RepID=A0A919MI85_9ACTN|nr:alpha/beta fold hydrolase [Actinoplanes ferrugineus]GIE16608.1 hypothetical protein Afe05nite_84480 [Actinoplanes ferrugineus]